jgi:hypothetical protein
VQLLALVAMAAQAQARRVLQIALPSRTTAAEQDNLITEFRDWFQGLPDATSVEEMANGAVDIAPELFDASILADPGAFRGQWMAIMNGIQSPPSRFDWAGTNWVRMRQRVTLAMNARPAPALPPKPVATAKADEYVWGKEKPAGFREGEAVLPGLINKAVDEALLVRGDDRGLVTVGATTYIVEKKVGPAPGALPVAKSETGLGRFRESVIFAPEYQRVGEKVLRDVSQRSESVEQYVKSTFPEMALSDREKYDQLVLSGLTVDQMLKMYDGKPKSDILADNTIELHLSNIALADYVARTGNVAGAKAVSGVQGFLLPQAVCEAAAKHTQAQYKLQNSMQTAGGGKGRSRSQFVPVSQRKCYGCGEVGHLLANCPNLSNEDKQLKMQELAAMQAAGKGKGKGAPKKP